jgi:uncharacterized repeat protein (TIGR01451 family)
LINLKIMRLFTTVLLLISLNSFSQLTGTISGTNTLCLGAGGAYNIAFTGFNGTAPYTFTYNINGGPTQSISTIGGATQVSFGADVSSPGVNNYNILSVQDAAMSFQTLTGTATVTVNPLPVVSAGPDQFVCEGTVVVLNGTGAVSYSWSNGVANGVPFGPPIGTSNITVTGTSSAGCVNTDQVFVVVDQIPVVNLGPDHSICVGDSVQLTSSIAGTGPFTYSWYPFTDLGNAMIVEPYASPTVTTTYTLSATSQYGCYGFDEVTVYVTPFPPSLPSVTIDSSYCNDGSIQLTSSQPGASVAWQIGSTSSMLTNLSPGNYAGTYTDGYGCQSSISYTVPLSVLGGNCPEISGSVHIDYDSDCLVNGLDQPLANRLIVANPGNYLTTTDQNGNYSMSLPIGTYIVEEIINDPGYLIGCTPNYSFPLLTSSDSIGGLNFMDTLLNPIDVSTTIFNTDIAPGFNFYVYPQFNSTTPGVSVQSLDAWITIPSGVTMTTWAHPHTQSNDTVYFSLNGFSSPNNVIHFVANTTLPLGMVMNFCSGIEVVAGEQNVLNNICCYSSIVTGSFDPNDKTMFLNGVQSDSTIFLTDQMLDYVIRFQNTGTAPAQDIFILDTISTTLDLNSFEYVIASHNCTVSILENNVLKFNFPQIFLPDSTNNEPESHGFVRYRIRQSSQNVTGTVINNTAYIYFDFNEAVVTNTTYDIIVVDDLGIEEEDIFNVKLFPNPTTSILNVESESIIDAISVFSLNGQLVKQLSPSSKKSTIDLSDLTKGVYLFEINCEKDRIIKRIIVQ